MNSPKSMQGKTYLVTGSTGFIGTFVTARLRAAGHTVLEGVLGPPRNPHQLRCSLGSTVDEWRNLIRGCDGVVHLAWSTLPSSANLVPVEDLNTNLVGTVRLLEAMRQQPGTRLVFASSGGTVYGKSGEVRLREDHALRPVSVYGTSKLAAETYLMLYRRQWNVDARILRVSNSYGPGLDIGSGGGVATSFAARALRGEGIDIYGCGRLVRDYVYIEDVASAFEAMLETPVSAFSSTDPVVNIGSGVGISLDEIVSLLEKLLQRPLTVTYKSARSFDVGFNVLDITLARRVLGWSPSVSFENGMRKTLDGLFALSAVMPSNP